MSVLNNSLLLGQEGGAGYVVQRSLRFSSNDSAFLSRTPASAGNRKTYTIALWVKSAVTGASNRIFGARNDANNYMEAYITSGNKIDWYFWGGGLQYELITTQVFRDPSAWYHLMFVLDTTQATANNRIRIYVNGSEVTTFDTRVNPSLNFECAWNNTVTNRIGVSVDTSSAFFNGYMADIHSIDGQALTPSSFTEVSATTGQLIPKKYTGAFTGNSFWLQFADNSAATATTLGKDSSGLGNNWTPNNLSVTAGAGNDSLVDTPTSGSQVDTGAGGEVTGNYATLNPLAKASNHSLSNGNLDLTPSGHGTTTATLAVTAGMKVYMEFLRTGGTAGGGWGFTTTTTPYQSYPGQVSGLWWVYDNGGNFGFNDQTTIYEYASKTTTDQILQLAIDYNAGKAWIGINNTWFTTSNATTGNPGTGANPTFTFTTNLPLFPLVEAAGWTVSCNFGQRQWAYAAPAGFKALCDTNLPAPVVAKGSTVMDTVLWTGNNTGQTITLPGAFSPDLIWTKIRNAANNHWLFDVIRGANQGLSSSSTTNELTRTDSVTAFGSSGFTLGTSADVNSSAYTYVAWCWDAGSSTVTNTQGSITSQVRANASSGFSIVTYQANAPNNIIGHGLGVRPEFVITKARTRNDNWLVYHSALGVNQWLHLNLSAAAITTSGIWGTSGNWTSTTFGVSTSGIEGNNYGSNDFVAYCFAPVAGFSAMGSWAAASPPVFVYTGFRPALLMAKSSTAAEPWYIRDSKRSAVGNGNPTQYTLFPNRSQAESDDFFDYIDFVSNGFVIRGSSGGFTNSGTMIYCAFAESPFQYSRAR